MTYDPGDPNRPYEFPPLEHESPQENPYAPVDYPSVPQNYPPPQPNYAPPPFPPPYQGYGPDPYDPYRAARPPGTNGQAIGAFVAALVGLPFCMCGVPSLVGLILGIIALGETKRTGQDGHGLALAAVIVGGVGLAFCALLWIITALPTSSY
jgi:hypothetical protein